MNRNDSQPLTDTEGTSKTVSAPNFSQAFLLPKMSKVKPGFIKSSTSSTDKSCLDNTSEPSCGGTRPKQMFTLSKKQNNQPLLHSDQGSYSASLPRAVDPLGEVAANPSKKSTSPSKQPQPQQQQSSPGIQAFRQLLVYRVAGPFEITKRVATIEALESTEKYNQNFQESENLGQRETETTKTEKERSDLNSGINTPMLSYSYSSASSIIASKIAGSPPLSYEPYLAMQAIEEHLQIQSADLGNEVSKYHQVLEVLQRAARQVRADRSVSQAHTFHFLAPLAIFLYLLGIGVLLPRQQRYRYSQTPEENTSISMMILLFFIGMSLILVIVRGVVWVGGVLGKAFCEADLTQVFRRGECVDVDGRGMGEAELIVGGMFM